MDGSAAVTGGGIGHIRRKRRKAAHRLVWEGDRIAIDIPGKKSPSCQPGRMKKRKKHLNPVTGD